MAEDKKKLKILCLHGYNNTNEIMMFQMQNFINTFGEICEFNFIEGPKPASEPPIKYFVQKGIKPPYKAWASMRTSPYKTLADGKTVIDISKSIVNYDSVQESIMLLINHLNQQDQPYDGLAGFS